MDGVTAVAQNCGDCFAVPLVGRPTKHRSQDVLTKPSLVSLSDTCTQRTIPTWFLVAGVSCLRARGSSHWRCRSGHVSYSKNSKRKAMADKLKESMDPLEVAVAELTSPVGTPTTSSSKGVVVDADQENVALKEELMAMQEKLNLLEEEIAVLKKERKAVAFDAQDKHPEEFTMDIGAAGHQIAEDTFAAVHTALRTATVEQKLKSASASEEVKADGTETRDDVGDHESKFALVGQLESGDPDDVQEALNMLQAELQNSGFSEEQIKADADIQYLQGCLQDIDETTVGDKVIPWELPQRHQTRKASKTEWFHRKYQRRTGQLGPHYFNKLEGKSRTKKKKIMKEFILAKRQALKRQKKRGEPTYYVDEALPMADFDDE